MSNKLFHPAFEEAKKQFAINLEVLSPQLSEALFAGIVAYVQYMMSAPDNELNEGIWITKES